MIDACRANGVLLGVAYYRRFYPVIRRIKEILASGEIGRPGLVSIRAFEWQDIPEGSPRSWFLRKDRAGGGPLMDFGCHRIEVLVNLLGPVEEVSGLVGNTLFLREVEDTATVGFRFRNQTMGLLAGSISVREPCDSLDLYGSEGSLHVPELNQGTLRVIRGGEERSEDHPPHATLHQPLVEDFAFSDTDVDFEDTRGDLGLNYKIGAQRQIWLKGGRNEQHTRFEGELYAPSIAELISELIGRPVAPTTELNGTRSHVEQEELQFRYAAGGERLRWSLGAETSSLEQSRVLRPCGTRSA